MADQKHPTVMLVDDEQLLLDLYVKGFTDAGYSVSSYTSAAKALESLKAGDTPDVILFDIHMPDLDGFVFLEIVKRDNLAPNAKMIALTNEAKEEDIKRILELGADAHYVKSQLSPSDIVAAVKGLLRSETVPS